MKRLAGTAAAILFGGAAWAQSPGSVYENERWGYRVRVPDGWKEAALSSTEEWIASKHLDTRALEAKKSEFYEADYPQMWVIGFPHARRDDRGARVREEDGETIVTIKNPYKDYKDFVKREQWFVGGGYYFSREEEDEHAGMKVTKYEIRVEKMVSAPYRIVTWVYHLGDVDFAVQFKILEDYYEKYEPTFEACLRSFREIPRKKALPGAASTGESIFETEDEKDLSPEERAKRRQERFERTLAAELEKLPDGWYVERSGRYVALANADRKFVRDVLKHAEVVRDYMEDTFGAVGSDYVPPGIIRVFATNAEAEAFHRSTGELWFLRADQVTVSQESSRDRKTWAMESVNAELAEQWFGFKNQLLYENLPFGLSAGLTQHMKFVRVKGRRCEVKPDEYDREYVRDIIRQEKSLPLRALFSGDAEHAMHPYQAGSILSYMLTKGNRGKWKGLIQQYLANLIGIVEEAQAAFEKARDEAREAAMAAATEDVEESEEETGEDGDADPWEKLLDAIKEKGETIRTEAFEKTFGHLSDRDWEVLDRAWREEVD